MESEGVDNVRAGGKREGNERGGNRKDGRKSRERGREGTVPERMSCNSSSVNPSNLRFVVCKSFTSVLMQISMRVMVYPCSCTRAANDSPSLQHTAFPLCHDEQTVTGFFFATICRGQPLCSANYIIKES